MGGNESRWLDQQEVVLAVVVLVGGPVAPARAARLVAISGGRVLGHLRVTTRDGGRKRSDLFELPELSGIHDGQVHN